MGTQTAQIVDGYPLDPISPLSLQILTDAQRFGRYLRVGRVRDVTNLAGSLGSANALLTVNVDTDARRISGVHHEAVTSDTHVFADSSAGGTDCFDLAFPYDPHLSKLYAATYSHWRTGGKV